MFDHVKSGRWATVLPEKLAKTLGVEAPLRAIPIVEPEAVYEIGLIAPQRDPVIPSVAALVAEAKALADIGVRAGDEEVSVTLWQLAQTSPDSWDVLCDGDVPHELRAASSPTISLSPCIPDTPTCRIINWT